MADAGAINIVVLTFDWYKVIVVTGTEQNNFSDDCTKSLKNSTPKVDTNAQKSQKKQDILKGIKKPKIV